VRDCTGQGARRHATSTRWPHDDGLPVVRGYGDDTKIFGVAMSKSRDRMGSSARGSYSWQGLVSSSDVLLQCARAGDRGGRSRGPGTLLGAGGIVTTAWARLCTRRGYVQKRKNLRRS
jgi:hypothetical protein